MAEGYSSTLYRINFIFLEQTENSIFLLLQMFELEEKNVDAFAKLVN